MNDGSQEKCTVSWDMSAFFTQVTTADMGHDRNHKNYDNPWHQVHNCIYLSCTPVFTIQIAYAVYKQPRVKKKVICNNTYEVCVIYKFGQFYIFLQFIVLRSNLRH